MDAENNNTFDGAGRSRISDVGSSPDFESGRAQGKSGKVWRIVSICLIVLALGLGVVAVLFFLQMNAANDKNDTLRSDLDARTLELNRYRELTATENPDEIAGGANGLADLTEMFAGINAAIDAKLSVDFLVYLDEAFVKNSEDGKYQIASFGVMENGDDLRGGFTAFLYRELPDGEWKFSNFSGQAIPVCSEVAAAEQAAFRGVLECEAE